MLTKPAACGICGGPLPGTWACGQIHPDHCHECYSRNLASGLDAREHRAPIEPLVLSPRDVQALVAYQQRVARLRLEDTDYA